MPKFAVIEAPSILGLRSTGVERLPDALIGVNLLKELGKLFRVLLKSARIVGMDVTIFNPDLDKDGSIARNLVSSIARGLS